MGQVLSIETAARFGSSAGPYAGFLMNTRTVEELLLIKLPLEAETPPTDVMVLVRAVTSVHGGEISLVMQDQDGDRLVRNFVGSPDMPTHYNSRSLGSLGEFMSRHAEQVEALVLAGATAHGNLTMARAAHLMASQKMEASEALGAAIDIGRSVQSMHDRQSSLVRAALA